MSPLKIFSLGVLQTDLYSVRLGQQPSNNMLDSVGLDFDNDLGGLHKGLPVKKALRLHPGWAWLAISVVALIFAVNPVAGGGFIAGAAFGVAGMLIIEALPK